MKETCEKRTFEHEKQKKRWQYLFNTLFILIAAIVVGFLFLRDTNDRNLIFSSLKGADWRYLIIIVTVMFLFYAIDGLIVYIFARLYTTNYRWHRGLAVSFIGGFYEDITPTKNGIFPKVKTLRKQKLKISSAASIIIMYTILAKIVLIGFGFFVMVFNFDMLVAQAEPISIFGLAIPVWVFSLIGFIYNAVVIFVLFLMTSWKTLHNFIIDIIIKVGYKLKLIKYPEEKKAKLKVNTENFRVELKRLRSNIPVTVLIIILFIVKYFLLYSIPYFAGSAILGAPMVYADGTTTFMDALSMNAFLEMITNLIPIPGNAGIAEYMFTRVYKQIYIIPGGADIENTAFLNSGNLLWRFSTFYFELIVGAFVAAFYKSRLEIETEYELRAYHELQSQTLMDQEENEQSLRANKQLSRREINERLRDRRKNKRQQDLKKKGKKK